MDPETKSDSVELKVPDKFGRDTIDALINVGLAVNALNDKLTIASNQWSAEDISRLQDLRQYVVDLLKTIPESTEKTINDGLQHVKNMMVNTVILLNSSEKFLKSDEGKMYNRKHDVDVHIREINIILSLIFAAKEKK